MALAPVKIILTRDVKTRQGSLPRAVLSRAGEPLGSVEGEPSGLRRRCASRSGGFEWFKRFDVAGESSIIAGMQDTGSPSRERERVAPAADETVH